MAGGGIPFEVFLEFSLLLVAAAFAGALFMKLKQPALVAFLVIGIAIGPSGLNLTQTDENVALLAVVGVIVLLVLVGLKLDLDHVKNIGPVALATGLGQLTFTILGGFILSLILGFNVIESVYIAVALTFSSTIIIVKLLTDKKELEQLHGRIAVGFLIVQDLAVVLAMMVLSSFGGTDGDQSTGAVLIDLVIRLAVAVVGLIIVVKFLVTPLLGIMASSEELLLIFVIAWGLGLAALGEAGGFSKEAGAFVAGFTLATTPYHKPIYTRVSGLRDFLILFFFIDLGANLDLTTLGAQVAPALVLSVFVLVGNPVIVMAIMGYMGYKSRTGFLAGLTVAQISEFSLVFIALGISLGQLDTNSLGLVTLVGLITITLSTYMILYSQSLYTFLSPWLKVFEREVPFREIAAAGEPSDDNGSATATGYKAIVVGMGRFGGRITAMLQAEKISVMGIDSDPQVIAGIHKAGLMARYGDIQDPEFLKSLDYSAVKTIILTMPGKDARKVSQDVFRAAGYSGHFTFINRERTDPRDFSKSGARDDAGNVTTFNLFTDAADYTAGVLAQQLTTGDMSPHASPATDLAEVDALAHANPETEAHETTPDKKKKKKKGASNRKK